ncbi:hypothetical protein EUX98_g1752 [Antrodiella citrinella]|uniref:F-box domain-containing protein n=1 Tax=Antrodiella citrinella TaxID=2447956 RepID=A0A4S4N0L1_9APHY|nr:hypothetical protein EUX98_g1752 [Antrodiella citrinella]
MAVIHDVPPEVLEQIILELDPLDVAQFSQSNSVFANYIYEPANQLLWRKLYLTQFLDDPRTCIGPLGERVKEEVDWKRSLQRVIRAKVIVGNPSVCREEEREQVVLTLLYLVLYLPPNPDSLSEMSRNLAWLADTLRGGTFFDVVHWPLSEDEKVLRARLHTCFGITTHDFRAKRRIESRGFVYAMRNYQEANGFGPFLMDYGGRVNWEHMLYIHHCMSMHIIPQGIPERPDVFTIFPLSLPYCQSVIPDGMDLDTEPDWAGVTGDWHCSFAFCDHRELLLYNNYNLADDPRLRIEVFEDPSFSEVFRTMHVKVKLTSTEHDPEHPTRPKIYWQGNIGGSHMMSGWVKVTPDNCIRWHFESGEQGLPMWSSQAVQIGGVRSSFGVLGVWTTVLHDAHDPVRSGCARSNRAGSIITMTTMVKWTTDQTPSFVLFSSLVRMSDPPKKLGSLKDRIAAFENKGTGPAPAPAPVPRPKPASAATWKPKPPTPPDSPRASLDSADRKAGMSAADAKESITKGGSLKDRMAALQGRGGFGGSPPPVAPKPALEKPKWKPPPVVSPPTDDEDEDEAVAAPVAKPPVVSPPVADVEHEHEPAPKASEDTEAEAPAPTEEEEGEKEVDPQEEERQRRAAIAARMARLGGARVGMGAPPIFGKKPDVEGAKPKAEDAPKLTTPAPKISTLASEDAPKLSIEETKSSDAEAVTKVPTPPPAPAAVESAEEAYNPAKAEDNAQDYFATTKPSAHSSTSVDSVSSVKSPSMPVPAGPRRAGPPRKKAGKSPQPVLDDGITQSPVGTPLLGDNVTAQEAVEAVQDSKVIEEVGSRESELVGSEQAESLVVPDKPVEAEVSERELHDDAAQFYPGDHAEGPRPTVSSPPVVTTEQHEPVAKAESATTIEEPDHDSELVTEDEHASEDVLKVEDAPEVREAPKTEEAPAEEEDEEEEAARRKRIAERLAKSGGFNPLSGLPPPFRSPSIPAAEEEAAAPVSPTVPERRASQRRSTDSTSLSQHRTSTDSTSFSQRRTSTDSGAHVPPPIRRPSVRQDQKSIVHESVHRHHPSVSEDITEEPESVADELENTGSEESAAAHGSHEDRRASADVGRPDLSSKASRERRVSYLQVEEEEVAEHVQSDQEYEPPLSDRAPSPTSAYEEDGAEVTEAEALHELAQEETEPEALRSQAPVLPPPTKRISVPPPSQVAPSTVDNAGDPDLHGRPSVSRVTIPPPPPIGSLPLDSDSESSAYPTTPGTAFKSPPPPALGPISPPPPVPPLPRTAGLPPSTPIEARPDRRASEQELVSRSPPKRKDSVQRSRVDAPPRPPVSTRPSIPAPLDDLPPSPSAPRRTTALPSRHESLPKTSSPLKAAPIPLPVTTEPEEEVLSEEDGDPIDPLFTTPNRSSLQAGPAPPATPVTPATPAMPPPPPQSPAVPLGAPDEEEEERSRRRTIAERMAKLGGIRLGAPMGMPQRAQTAKPEESGDETKESDGPSESEEPAEEDEFARKQRIAARIAGMGGMRFGMVPGVMSPPPLASSPGVGRAPSQRRGSETGAPARPTYTAPKVPTASTPLASTDESEAESAGEPPSDDGVQVEAEESEMEEIHHAEVEEEAPPPVPSRPARGATMPSPAPSRPPPVPRMYSRPAVPTGRPPVPSPRVSVSPARDRRSTADPEDPGASTYLSPGQQPLGGPSSPNDYVMVEQPESMDEPPPPPPPSTRPSRAPPPPRSIPTPGDMSESVAQSWELPQIPTSSLDMGGEMDMSESGQWSEVPHQEPEHPPTGSGRPSLEPARRPSSQFMERHTEINLSADDLMAQWGRVGVQIHEIAATLLEKSKKTVVGDGSYTGFVTAAISQVPNAAAVSPPEGFGYLIYSQIGSAVQRRASDIMPGDVIVLQDAKLKGHKGLQIYHQNVGVGEPVVAIVGDFETKRSKVKVFKANQHVGQQSVETMSYRLEDVKSGIIKIYRVLEK